MMRIIFPLFFAVATLVSAHAFAQPAALAENAPDSYTVVRGDTLWDISGRFLQEPWRWPEVWRLNRDEIRNPHLIYPGQMIFLDRSGPYLSIGRRVGDDRVSPQVHSEPLDRAIASIPLQDIESFLTRPLVVDEGHLESAGTIVATENKRVFMGDGDVIFAKDIAPGSQNWQIFKPASPLVDPQTGETLAYEADYLGTARVTAPGVPALNSAGDGAGVPATPATLQIISAVEEIGVGDRLIEADRSRPFSFVPRAPERDLDGRIIGIYRGVVETGRHHVVTLNVGARAGLEPGHVVALFRERGSVEYREGRVSETFDLPENRYGIAFVFRVFDRVAYALVMETDGQVTVGDNVRAP